MTDIVVAVVVIIGAVMWMGHGYRAYTPPKGTASQARNEEEK